MAKGNHHADAATKEAARGQPPDKSKVLLALETQVSQKQSPRSRRYAAWHLLSLLGRE